MKVSIATLLLLAYSVVLMQSFAYGAITEEQIDAFLAEQGAPEIVIQKLPFDLKKAHLPRRINNRDGGTYLWRVYGRLQGGVYP